MPILSVSHLTINLNQQAIISDLDFTVDPGQTLAVIGPNGAGKTILFKALLGLIPYSGTITWAPNTKIGYVPQRFAIDPDLPLTVAEFFHLKHVSDSQAQTLLADVGFTDAVAFSHKNLSTLSGGQLQRVLIAWAISDSPNVLLFDEPTTGVDITAEESIYSLLHRLSEKQKLTILLISHELQVVYRYATNVLCLNKEGLCFGPPHTALTPKTLTKLFGENTGIYQHHQHHL